MNRSTLFVVTSDPRISPRPAEAVRIAAGVGVWKKVDVTLYLRDAAVLALTEFPDELMDEDNYVRYLPIIGEFGRPVYVQRGAPLLKELGEARVKYEEVTDEAFAELAAKTTYLLQF